MKITKLWLQKHQACIEAINEFESYQGDTFIIPLLKEMIVRNKLEWANWLIVQIMTYKQYVAYACFAAKQVLELYERQYPDDLRPETAIKAAEKCIENRSKMNQAAAGAAGAAAWAARAAGAAAEAAAWAARAAAWAARAAAWAARAAAWAARDAGAAAEAARDAMQIKILTYGIDLLREESHEF